MVYYNSNYCKGVGYIVDLCDGNYKNDLDAPNINMNVKKNHIKNGCVYNNIDNRQ